MCVYGNKIEYGIEGENDDDDVGNRCHNKH
jgi:hypothetical protein